MWQFHHLTSILILYEIIQSINNFIMMRYTGNTNSAVTLVKEKLLTLCLADITKNNFWNSKIVGKTCKIYASCNFYYLLRTLPSSRLPFCVLKCLIISCVAYFGIQSKIWNSKSTEICIFPGSHSKNKNICLLAVSFSPCLLFIRAIHLFASVYPVSVLISTVPFCYCN